MTTSFLFARELSPGKVQRTGQRAFLLIGQTGLDNLRAIVAKFSGELLAIAAINDVLVLVIVHDNRDDHTIDADVVSQGCGLVEAIDPGITGLAVPPNDPHATAEAIIALLSDDAMRAEMGRRAQDRALR